MGNSKDAMWIANAIDLAISACDTIAEKNHCCECPLFASCLKEESFEAVMADVGTTMWCDFLDMSDELIDWVSDDDAQRSHDDLDRDLHADMELEFEEI